MNIATIFTSIRDFLDIPSIALLVMFCGAFYVLREAQARPDFDLGNILKNDAGKESASALGAIIAIVLSGWTLVYDTVKHGQVDSDIFIIYLAIWSGTKVAEKLVDAIASKWGK